MEVVAVLELLTTQLAPPEVAVVVRAGPLVALLMEVVVVVVEAVGCAFHVKMMLVVNCEVMEVVVEVVVLVVLVVLVDAVKYELGEH